MTSRPKRTLHHELKGMRRFYRALYRLAKALRWRCSQSDLAWEMNSVKFKLPSVRSVRSHFGGRAEAVLRRAAEDDGDGRGFPAVSLPCIPNAIQPA